MTSDADSESIRFMRGMCPQTHAHVKKTAHENCEKPAILKAVMRFATETRLVRSHRQLLLLTRWRDRAGLRDQAFQFRNAGAAIGAGLQLHADLGSRSGARRDGVANRGAADPKAGADDRAGAGQSIDRFARQQHPALIVAEPIRSE